MILNRVYAGSRGKEGIGAQSTGQTNPDVTVVVSATSG